MHRSGILNTPADLIYSGKLETECYTYGSTSTVAANTPEDGAGDAAADGGGDESEHERSIRLFGLWDPQPFGDMLPVLLILLLATWHAHNDQSRMHLFTDFLKKLSSTFATNGPSTAPASARFPPPVSQLSPVRSGEAYEPPAPSTHSRGRDSARTVVPVESGVGVEAMNKVQEALIKLAGHVATSYGVVGVVLVTYIMVVVNVEPGCVLGLGYLALISAMVILPPLVRASIAAKMGSPQDANPHHSPRSGKLRWAFVTCLGLYALADFLTQYALAFPLRVQYLEMSRGTEEDLRTTWGFLPLNEGWDLFKMLLRPTLIMWSLTLYRMGYKVGMSIKMTGRIKGPLAAGRDAEEADRELDKHATLTFTMRRFFIRNRVNMLILFCFFDAVRNPGVLGLCFVVLFAVAILSYVLVGRRSAAAAVSLSGRMSGAGVWLIRTYAVVTLLMLWILQLDVLREGLLDTSSRALLWFNWLGLPATDFDVSAGFSLRKESPDMEQVLRPKALLVAFVGIEVAAVRWLASLPEPIKAEGAKSGQPCALFWPPIGAQLDSVEQQLEEELKKPDMGILSVSLWQRLHRRLKPFIEAVKVQFRSTDAGDEAARSRTELGGPRELGATLADRITPRDLPPPQRPGRRSVDDGPYRKPFSMGRELSRELTDPAHGRAGSSPTRKALKGMSMRKLTNNFAVAGGASPPPKDAWFPRGTPPKALAGTVPAADSGGPGLGKSRGGKHRRTKTHAALGAGGAEGQHVAMLMGPTVSKAKHQRARSGGSEGRGAGGRDVEREEGEAAREKDKEKKKKKKKKKPLTEVDKAVLRERTIRGNIQRKFLRIAAMNIIESGWIRFGSELATLFILLAAFASFSLLSFLMICLVVAMVTARTANPKHMSITYPIVAAGSVALIIFQYAVVMGWPPSHPDYRPPDWVDPYESPVPVPVVTSEQEHDILKDSVIKDDAIGRWLGVQRVEVATLWCLFFAVASVMNELIRECPFRACSSRARWDGAAVLLLMD